jgi:UPF0716 protein FxsA
MGNLRRRKLVPAVICRHAPAPVQGLRRTSGAGGRFGSTIDDPDRGANKAPAGIPPMSLLKWVIIGLILLPAAEIAAFLLAAALLGWLWALILFGATSAAGALLLRRYGRADLDRLRAAVAADGLRGLNLETPGAASMLGGILLLAPGFITDALGAVLFLPPFRRWVALRWAAATRRRREARRDARTIDLEPGEWRQIPDRPRTRHRKPRAKPRA